jgi:hypothetical protein
VRRKRKEEREEKKGARFGIEIGKGGIGGCMERSWGVAA